MNSSQDQGSSLTMYLLVYVAILFISALQILVAYEHIDVYRIFIRMLLLAIIQAGLAITFFMHMRSEKRTLALFLLPATVFVLTMMNMIWSDSFRLLNMRPFAH
jgi:cytochrome c oxidase subunit IV